MRHKVSSQIWLVFLISGFFAFAGWFQGALYAQEQFVHLAESFLQGKLYFTSDFGRLVDAVSYGGHYFWALGPLPAVILMPLVLFASWLNVGVPMGGVHLLVGAAVFGLVYILSRTFRFSSTDSLFFSFAFCFASPLFGILAISWSWFFAQLITVALVIISLIEWRGRKRFWFIGLLFAAIVATRFTVGVGIVFFLFSIVFSSTSVRKKMVQLTQLCLPVVSIVLLLGVYNFVRFDSPFETGYSWQSQIPAAAQAREYGVFSIRHLPGNAYYLFLNAPDPVFRDAVSHVLTFPFLKPDPWGISILITSPYLLYLFLTKPKDKESWFILVTSFAILLPLLLFYGSGFFQIGSRYSLDFFPFLFFLILHQYSKKHTTLSFGLKTIFIASAFWNGYLILSILV